MAEKKEFGNALKNCMKLAEVFLNKPTSALLLDMEEKTGIPNGTLQTWVQGATQKNKEQNVSKLYNYFANISSFRGEVLNGYLNQLLITTNHSLKDSLVTNSAYQVRIALPYKIEKFIDRKEYKELLAELVPAINSYRLVFLTGNSGTGKSTLASEAAWQLLDNSRETAAYDAVFWFNCFDREKNGHYSTDLEKVINEIARGFDIKVGDRNSEPHELQEPLEQKVKRVISDKRILLIFDDFYLLTAMRRKDILSWVISLSGKNKGLFISKTPNEMPISNEAYLMEIESMSEAQLNEYIKLKAKSVGLPLEKPFDVEKFLRATNQNLKIIEIALGVQKTYEEDSRFKNDFQKLIETLKFDKDDEPEKILFERIWEKLNEKTRTILRIIALFKFNARKSAVKEIYENLGFGNEPYFEQDLSQLIKLSFVTVTKQTGEDKNDRLTLKSFIKEIDCFKWDDKDTHKISAQNHQVAWCIKISSKVGWCWNDLRLMDNLLSDIDNFLPVIELCMAQGKFTQVVELTKGLSYFYDVKGEHAYWQAAHELAMDAARVLRKQDPMGKKLTFNDELWLEARHLEGLALLGKTKEALPIFNDLEYKLEHYDKTQTEGRLHALISKSVYLCSQEAPDKLEQGCGLLAELKREIENLSLRDYAFKQMSRQIECLCQYWLANFTLLKVEYKLRNSHLPVNSLIEEYQPAINHFKKLFDEADAINYVRPVRNARLYLLYIEIMTGVHVTLKKNESDKDLFIALGEIEEESRNSKDKRFVSHLNIVKGSYFLKENNLPQAQAVLEEVSEYYYINNGKRLFWEEEILRDKLLQSISPQRGG